MQFMGDQSKPRGKDELTLLFELLKVSENCVPRPGAPCLPAWAWVGLSTPPHTSASQFFSKILHLQNGSRHYFSLFYSANYKCLPKSGVVLSLVC